MTAMNCDSSHISTEQQGLQANARTLNVMKQLNAVIYHVHLVLQAYESAVEQLLCMNEREVDYRIDFFVPILNLNQTESVNSSDVASSRRLLSRSGSKTKSGGSGATNRNADPMRSRQLFDRYCGLFHVHFAASRSHDCIALLLIHLLH